MSDLNTALQIAATAHAGQEDKLGGPYITHPLRVMSRCTDSKAQIVGVLHDVVEDTSTTLDDLKAAGFDEQILEAVSLTTHAKEDSYADYVVRLKSNPLAREVKLADLHDNSRLDRMLLRPERIERDLARIHRYLLTYRFLTDGITEPQYRELMARYGAEK